MRTGEVFALTWNDIDLESRIIKVNKTVYAKNKNSIGRWYIGTTKTEGSEREIYICDTLYSILFDYKEQQDRNKKKFGKKYKKYSLEKIKNKYGKVVEYVIAESKVRKDKVDMVFTKNDGTYSGTDVIKYPFKRLFFGKFFHSERIPIIFKSSSIIKLEYLIELNSFLLEKYKSLFFMVLNVPSET